MKNWSHPGTRIGLGQYDFSRASPISDFPRWGSKLNELTLGPFLFAGLGPTIFFFLGPFCISGSGPSQGKYSNLIYILGFNILGFFPVNYFNKLTVALKVCHLKLFSNFSGFFISYWCISNKKFRLFSKTFLIARRKKYFLLLDKKFGRQLAWLF